VRAATAVPAGAVALLLAVCVAGLSRIPLRLGDEHESLVRLSWRMDGFSLGGCRIPTAEELAALPVHMRNPEACIGQIASYRLFVTIDGESVVDETVRPAGARHDRPLYVLADLPVDPGRYELAVRFEAILPEGAPPPGAESLSVEEVVTIERRDIVLVTLDPDTQRLVVRVP